MAIAAEKIPHPLVTTRFTTASSHLLKGEKTVGIPNGARNSSIQRPNERPGWFQYDLPVVTFGHRKFLDIIWMHGFYVFSFSFDMLKQHVDENNMLKPCVFGMNSQAA